MPRPRLRRLKGGGVSDNQNLKIVVEADTAGAVKGLQAVDKASEGLERELKNTAEAVKSLDSKFKTIEGAGKQLGSILTTIGGAFLSVKAVKMGAEIADVNGSFEKLSESAGVSANALRDKLKAATGETIREVDLLKIANQGLQAGLKPEVLDAAAKAARSYADAVGGDAAKELDALIDGLAKGNDAFLKSRGILIDNNTAFQAYADSTGKAVKSLSELDKAEAIRAAATTALIAKTKELGEVQNDTADSLDKVFATIENTRDKILEAVGTNENLGRSFNEVAETIKSVDASSFIEKVVNPIVNGIALSIKSLTDFSFNLDLIGAQLTNGAEGVQNVFKAVDARRQSRELEDFNKALSKTGDLMEASTKIIIAVADGVKFSEQNFKTFKNQVEKVKSEFAASGLPAQRYAKYIEDLDYQVKALSIRYSKDLTDGLDSSGKSAKLTEKELKALEKAQKAHNKELEKQQKLVEKLNSPSGISEYKKKITDLTNTYQDGYFNITELASGIEGLRQEFTKGGGSAEIFSKIIDNSLAESVTKIDSELGKIESEFKKTSDSILGDFLTGLGSSVSSEFAEIGKQLASGGFDFKASLANIGVSIGQSVGTAVGASLGGPVGAAAGNVIGGFLGEELNRAITTFGKDSRNTTKTIINSLFGVGTGNVFDKFLGDTLFGNSAGTDAKKKADAFFAQAFDKNRLSVVINGQLTQLSDLVFSGNQEGGLFSKLPAAAQSAFSGIGTAFEGLLGIVGDLGVNIGNVFANNVGGSLNNLQLLVASTGVSFEELGKQVEQSFLKGELSALKAEEALIAIQTVAEDGIPGALGAVDEAFSNVFAAGANGGAALVDALKDVGYEANELGIKDLGGLKNKLQEFVASGKFTQEQLTQYFAALAKNGIGSIDQLKQATTAQLISIASALQQSGALEESSDLLQNLNNLPSEKTIKINVDTRLIGDKAAAEVLNNSGIRVGQQEGRS